MTADELWRLAGSPARAVAVVAHPDDESFGLGGVLSALVDAGTSVGVICLTLGEASTLGARADLGALRDAELRSAARELGVDDVTVLGYPDGGLAEVAQDQLFSAVIDVVGEADLLLAFEPGGVTGHPDHRAATAVARRVAVERGLPLLEWGVSDEVAAALRAELGAPFAALEAGEGEVVEVEVDRRRQLAAIACHGSQATDNAVLNRRLQLQGSSEHVSMFWRSNASWSDPNALQNRDTALGRVDPHDDREVERGSSRLRLYWIPVGAGSGVGARIVRFSSGTYERLMALVEQRPRRPLFHAAVVADTPEGRYVVEMTPVPNGSTSRERGVVAEGAVGSPLLGRARIFRYEVRRWLGGTIPDLGYAVDSPVLISDAPDDVRTFLDLLPQVPALVWGRDELRAGEMWNSNAVVSWALTRAGLVDRAGVPPSGGRAPGWDAGTTVARRLETRQGAMT